MTGFLLGLLAFFILAAIVIAGSVLLVFRGQLFSDSRQAGATRFQKEFVGMVHMDLAPQNIIERRPQSLFVALSSFAVSVDHVEPAAFVAPDAINVFKLEDARMYERVQDTYVDLMRRVGAPPTYLGAAA